MIHVVRMISLDILKMQSGNTWFKWSEKGKWKTGGPGGLGGPGDPGVPGGQCGQDDQPK